ncbi:RNA-directed DNA polymerase, eukaryota [Tanacetum coccineum]
MWNPSFLVVKEKVYVSDNDLVRGEKINDMQFHLNDEEEEEGEFVASESADPFEIYKLLNHKKTDVEMRDSSQSLSHPPGFTPLVSEVGMIRNQTSRENGDIMNNESSPKISAKVMNKSQEVQEEVSYNSNGQSKVKEGGSVLGVLEEVIRVGQAMGYSMEGCEKDVESIIGNQGDDVVVGTVRIFDNFISSSSLVDVKMEGYSFTWSHASANKMSKLDRFLVFDGVISLFPSITAFCLDRHLSDHCPILLCEIRLDFGPVPFRMNGMIHFKKKLQELKKTMRVWIKDKNTQLVSTKCSISDETCDIDKRLDAGRVSDSLLFRRNDTKCQLYDIKSMEAMDSMQMLTQDQVAELEREHIFVNGSFSKGCNSSFVALILKVTDAKFVNDYRPISLIGSVYKVITKIMATCLAMIIESIVSDTQSKFVAKRQILDGPFILNEVLYWCKRKNKKAMFLRAVNDRLFNGIHLHGSLSLSQLFYADDALFIGKWGGSARATVEAMAISIGCSIMQNKFRYLGVMVGDCMSRFKAWEDVVINLRTRLSKWKAKTLSIGGRLTLLKSVLGASPLYTMSICKVPKGVLKEMESIRNNFFKGAELSEKKITWVAWDKSIHSSSLWSSILKEVHVLKDRGFDFLEKCSKRVGNGLNTRFWLDSWKGGTSFRETFPRLFALEMNHQISMKDKLAAALDSSFCRPVRGGLEKDQLTGLAAILDTVSLSPSLDRWVCSLSSDGDFYVKDARTNIDDMFLPSHNDSTRWVKGVYVKINIFTWRARRDCLPTRINLIQKGVTLETTSCPICLAGEEDVSHVFFQCPLAQAVLRRICRWWEVVWQQWSSFSEWLDWFSDIRLTSKVKSLLEGVYMVAWWAIWGFWNRSIFETSPPNRSNTQVFKFGSWTFGGNLGGRGGKASPI